MDELNAPTNENRAINEPTEEPEPSPETKDLLKESTRLAMTAGQIGLSPSAEVKDLAAEQLAQARHRIVEAFEAVKPYGDKIEAPEAVVEGVWEETKKLTKMIHVVFEMDGPEITAAAAEALKTSRRAILHGLADEAA